MTYIEKLNQLRKLIGNTPLIKINYKFKGQPYFIYAKLEYYNYTGSIKDRMALNILTDAYNNGKIKEGDEIVEATSGNTGIAFSALGAYLGHKVTIFMPNWMSKERINLIKSYGANIRLVSSEEGGFIGSIKLSEEYASRGNCFLPSQFANKSNTNAHYLTTAPEIFSKVKPDSFVAGVGTGGTLMGIGKYFKDQNKDIKVIAMEPASSPTLREEHKVGAHRIQGISDEFVPELVERKIVDEIIDVHDGDGIIMAKKLAGELGLGVGISSGANFIAAHMIQEKYGAQKVITIFADDNKKYLSTDYSKEEPMKEDYYSQYIELISFEVI